MKNLELTQMESFSGGSYACAHAVIGAVGLFAWSLTVPAVYEIGVIVNWWNPVGWGGAAAGAAIGAACIINELS